jgi:hypothetical protein
MPGHAGGAHHIEVPHRARPNDAEGSELSRWARWESPIDAVLVAILAVASLMAAWSAYQAHHWSAEQSSEYAHASDLRVESSRQSTRSMQLTIIDVTTFTNFINAFAQGDTKLADFYTARFRPDFKPAFNAWMAQNPLTNLDAPPSPFALPEYLLPETVKAQELDAEAEAAFAHGEESKEHSEEYVLNTVILAMTLFFAGIAPRVGWMPARIALMAVAVVFLCVGIFDVAVLPVSD